MCRVSFIWKFLYQLQETQATKALGRLDLWLKVPSEALESSKEIKIQRELIPIIPTWHGLVGLQKSLLPRALDESSLSIGRVDH